MEDQEPTNRRARRAAEKTTEGATPKDRNQRLRSEMAKRRKPSGDGGGLDALTSADRVDDVLVRSAGSAGKFLNTNSSWLQWVLVLGAAGGMAYLIWNFRTGREDETRGDLLAEAQRTQIARLASDETPKTTQFGLTDTRPEFASAEERSKAARAEWQSVVQAAPRMSFFAKLAEASALFDVGQYPQARAAYEAVLSDKTSEGSPLARTRALEGLIFSFEAEGDKDKAIEAARRLAASEGNGLLGGYHEARLEFLRGQRDKARELLAPLKEKLDKKRSPGAPPSYLSGAVEDLQKTIDPKPALPSGGLTPEMIERLQQQIAEMQKSGQSAPPLQIPVDVGDLSELPAAPEAPAEAAE